MKRPRRNHSAKFKARIALEALRVTPRSQSSASAPRRARYADRHLAQAAA
jgi:hypothetical protein